MTVYFNRFASRARSYHRYRAIPFVHCGDRFFSLIRKGEEKKRTPIPMPTNAKHAKAFTVQLVILDKFNNIATFSNVMLSLAAPYTLIATDSNNAIAGITSSPFNVA